MPYSILHLIRNQGALITVQSNDSIIHALDLMIEHDYSQLVVLDDEQQVLGMVTYESIMRAMRSFNVKLENLNVRDTLVKVPYHYEEDDLFDLLDELKDTNAVVIIDLIGDPRGIVTSYDTAEFLRDRTEDSMRISDIEYTIKEFIKLAYSDKNGELDEAKLDQAIARLYDVRNEQDNNKKQKKFNDLTLNEYISLIVAKITWDFFDPILTIQREGLVELLTKIRNTRNNLAHFRGEISPRERDELRYCADWLTRRYQEYEKQKEKVLIQEMFNREQDVKQPDAPKETPSNIVPVEKKNPSKSRYSALADWLSKQTEDQIALTFEQIEGIIRSPLPDSALVFKAWWANDTVGHTHSILWLEAGWRTTYINLDEKQVIFSRVK